VDVMPDPGVEPESEYCCRHHDIHCELHSSYVRLGSNTTFGFPLIYFEMTGHTFVAMLCLEECKREQGERDIVNEVVFQGSIADTSDAIWIVDLARLRTSCRVVYHEETFLVIIASERVFGHLE
jgi:hypothetical protein